MQDDKLTAKLLDANARLKSAKSRLKIKLRGNKLSLQGTFPPKPLSGKSQPYQQEIYTSANNTIAGIDYCFKLSQKITLDLESKTFNWLNYLQAQAIENQATISNLIADFKAQKIVSDRTWHDDYFAVFKHLPQDRELTADLILGLVHGTEPNTKTRRRYCLALRQLANFAEVELPKNFDQLMGNYSPTKVKPRDIPSDRTIIEIHSTIPNKSWRWAFGMLAVYGLSPHELLLLNFDDLPILTIAKGKHIEHRTWPIYPEWFQLFNLAEINQPPISNPDQCSKQFKRYKIPFPPYTLRHAWAIRSMEFGLQIELAAKQLGHSSAVHSQTYHQWISDRQQQQAFEILAAARVSK